MMYKRDLCAELNEQGYEPAPSCKAPRMMPPVPKGRPPQPVATIDSIRSEVGLAQHWELDAVICIKADDAFCNEFILNKDMTNCADITALCGFFFDSGVKLNGCRVWKTCFVAEGELSYYMFAVMDTHKGKPFLSWYVSDQLWSCEKEKTLCNKNDPPPHIVAWGTGAHYMVQCHFPYWSKKQCPQISICSLWDQALKTSEQLDQLIAEYGAPPTELQLAENDEVVDLEQVDSGKGKQGDKGKGFGGKGKHNEATHRGGWLPKMAKLCVAVLDQNFGRANQLANQFCENSHTLTSIVEKRHGSSSSSHGGWW